MINKKFFINIIKNGWERVIIWFKEIEIVL